MALSTTKLNQILRRQEECEKQTQLLQQQVQAFQSHFNIAPTQKETVPSQPESSTNIPNGKYVIFISTQTQPIPTEVIAAFLLAKTALISSGKIKDIKLNLVQKDDTPVPRVLTPAPYKTELIGSKNVTRLLLRIAGKEPSNVIDTTDVDSWMDKSNAVNTLHKDEFRTFISTLNNHLALRSVLVGYDISACDLSLWSALRRCERWVRLSASISPPNNGPIHALRWFTMMNQSEPIVNANAFVEESEQKRLLKQQRQQKQSEKQQKKKDKKEQKQRGSKVKAAASASWDINIGKEWDGRIVTRFPPEPSGFLHIGHAKAVFINWKIAQKFNGKMIVRMDDTNPAKEKAEFEENILRDLRSLGIKPDLLSHTSDYFAYYMKCCTRVIKSGDAYCDKTPPAEMKEERANRIENEYRAQSVDENVRLWKEMQQGTEEGQQTCVRIKLDMKSDNGTLRDPAIYRCNVKDSHHRTGRKFNVYPTYDFACPIVDSIEGVTHAFRSKEYNERNEQYKLVWDIVCKGQKNPLDDNGIIKKGSEIVLPSMFQFSRLDFVRTVLSKRKLAKLIERGVVEDWNDPRLPTVQGIMRRGMQLEALDRFVMDQAMSVVNTEQEWDKIWSYNADILDPKVGRYFAVSDDNVTIRISNVNTFCGKTVPLAPEKYEAMKGKSKVLEISSTVLVERFSITAAIEKNAKKNETRMILMNWGIINVERVNYDEQKKKITSVDATFEKDNANYRGKPALNWVADNGADNLVPVKLVELDYLFNYVERAKEDDEKKMEIALEENKAPTWLETNAFGESAVRALSKGDIIQFVKLGFFIVDKPFLGRASEPAILIHIPDGKEKKMSKVWQHLSKCNSGTGSKSALIANQKKQQKAKKNKGKNKKKNKNKQGA
eukprot:596944_1